MALCEICKNEFKVITYNHLKAHNLTTEQYAEVYPGSKFSWINGLNMKGKPGYAGQPKGMQMGHPPHFTKAYLGDRYDEINKRRLEKLKVSMHTPECKKKLQEGNHKGYEVRKQLPHFGMSDKQLQILRGNTFRKGIHPWNYGLSKETDERVARIGAINKILNIGRQPTKAGGKYKAGVRKDLKLYFRSTWEANFVRICNLLDIKWEYEPRRFYLDDCSYLPDFYLPEFKLWVEVKGQLTEAARIRLVKMSQFYPGEELIILGMREFRFFERMYSKVISNWEYIDGRHV